MPITTNYGYDYVFELASRLSPVEKRRLVRNITGRDTSEPGLAPYSPEKFYEFLLSGPVIEEEQIQLMQDAREEVNQCRPISW